MTNIAWAYLIFLSDAICYASFGSASVVLVTSFLLLCLHIYQSAAITVIDVLEGNPDLITKLKKNTSTLYKGFLLFSFYWFWIDRGRLPLFFRYYMFVSIVYFNHLEELLLVPNIN